MSLIDKIPTTPPSSNTTSDATVPTDRAVNHGVKGGHLPAPTDQARLGAPDRHIPRPDPDQSTRAHRFVHAFDVHPLRFRQHREVFDQPRGRL